MNMNKKNKKESFFINFFISFRNFLLSKVSEDKEIECLE